MEKERKFRFVGDPETYNKGLKKGMIYNENYNPLNWHQDVFILDAVFMYPNDWEKVTEQEEEMDYDKFFEEAKKFCTRIPNQDQPASSMTKFEMAVLGNVRTIVTMAVPIHELNCKVIVCDAIELAKETFKQLENLKK